MKATGIIRRIDELGRVVIPKEIRRLMQIQEGDPLEIFTTREGEVIFKRYFAEDEYLERINSLIRSMRDDFDFCGKDVRKKLEEAVALLVQEKG